MVSDLKTFPYKGCKIAAAGGLVFLPVPLWRNKPEQKRELFGALA